MSTTAIRARLLPAARSLATQSLANVRLLSQAATQRSFALTDQQVEQFQQDGYLVLRNAVSVDHPGENETNISVAQLRKEMCEHILDTYDAASHQATVFSTTNQQSPAYFLESGDKIRFFLEEMAAGDDNADIGKVVNKVGHALHWLNATFRDFTLEPMCEGIYSSLGFKKPLVAQSMYIFKQPGIGGEVVPHQDSTFLHTSPTSTVGAWIPLEKCTTSNGCLWASPGSHKKGVLRRMLRNDANDGTHFDKPQPLFDDLEFYPVEVNAGDVVLIHGEVVHKSDVNRSKHSRHAYTFHVIEGAPGYVYDKFNWLQPSNDLPFVPLFAEQRADPSQFSPRIHAQ